jgi:predicted outer membrane repeat protein
MGSFFLAHNPYSSLPKIWASKPIAQARNSFDPGGEMKSRKLICVAALTLFAAVPTALASTTWYVNGVSGSDSNNCMSALTACKTIGHAISLASSGDSIIVAPTTYTENLTIGFSLSVIGFGASSTIIDGGGANTVVTISNSNAHVTLSKLTIRNGHAQFGGGIYNLGMLTLSHSIIGGNHAFTYCPKGCRVAGGGIYSGGTLTINNSTISGNSAVFTGCLPFTSCSASASGGGMYSAGTLTINNSTISGNTASKNCGAQSRCQAYGGGIASGDLTLTIASSTLSGNSATRSGGGIYFDGALAIINNSTISGNSPFGIFNIATLNINNSTISGNTFTGIYSSGGVIQNSIVADNSTFNCEAIMISKGYNLSSDGSCNFNGTGDLNNTNPLLGPLQNNGGSTQTVALLSGSPAIDSGNPNGCTDGQGHLLKTDQRGLPRPDIEDTAGCDRGAFERQSD